MGKGRKNKRVDVKKLHKDYSDYLDTLAKLQQDHGLKKSKVILMPNGLGDNSIRALPDPLKKDHYGRPYFIDENNNMVIFITPGFYKRLSKRAKERIFPRIFRRKPLGSVLGLEDTD